MSMITSAKNLDWPLDTKFKRKLEERLQNPHVTASRLSGNSNRFKIKLRKAGYRLVYEVRDSEFIVVIIAVGKREANTVYKRASTR